MPADGLGAGAAQLVTAVDQQPQRHGGVVDDDLTQARGCAAPATATLWASTGSVLRPWPVANTRTRADSFARHVQHGLAVGDQALGDVPADAVAALHRPDPVRVLPASGEHLPVAVGVGAEPALRQHLSPVRR